MLLDCLVHALIIPAFPSYETKKTMQVVSKAKWGPCLSAVLPGNYQQSFQCFTTENLFHIVSDCATAWAWVQLLRTSRTQLEELPWETTCTFSHQQWSTRKSFKQRTVCTFLCSFPLIPTIVELIAIRQLFLERQPFFQSGFLAIATKLRGHSLPEAVQRKLFQGRSKCSCCFLPHRGVGVASRITAMLTKSHP